jgi:hypothetical protein
MSTSWRPPSTRTTASSAPTRPSAALSTNFVQGGFVPNYFGTSTVYVTLTSAAGNLGNGTTTNLLTGEGFLVIEADVLPRWVK